MKVLEHGGLVRLRLKYGTLLVVATALRTSGVAFPVALERLNNTAAPLQEPSPRTPDLSRVGPVMSTRWGHAHSERPRGLVRLQLRHDTLLVVATALRTSGVAFPVAFVLLNNTAVPLQEPSHLSRVGPVVSKRWRHAHSERPRGLVRLQLRHGTLLVVATALRTSGVAFPVTFPLRSYSASVPFGLRSRAAREPRFGVYGKSRRETHAVVALLSRSYCCRKVPWSRRAPRAGRAHAHTREAVASSPAPTAPANTRSRLLFYRPACVCPCPPRVPPRVAPLLIEHQPHKICGPRRFGRDAHGSPPLALGAR